MNHPILLNVGAVWCPWCAQMDRESYTVPETATFINQHFVAVKFDYDGAGPLVAELQRAQAILNLPAGLPLMSFITPTGELYYGAGYLPPVHTRDKSALKETLAEALCIYQEEKTIGANSFQIERSRSEVVEEVLPNRDVM